MPGPHPSATFAIRLSVLPMGAGATVAPAAVVMPIANAAPKMIVFIVLQLSPVSKPSRTHPRSGIGGGAKLPMEGAKVTAFQWQTAAPHRRSRCKPHHLAAELAELSRRRRSLLLSHLFGSIGEFRPRSRQHQLDGSAVLAPGWHCKTAPNTFLGKPPVIVG